MAAAENGWNHVIVLDRSAAKVLVKPEFTRLPPGTSPACVTVIGVANAAVLVASNRPATIQTATILFIFRFSFLQTLFVVHPSVHPCSPEWRRTDKQTNHTIVLSLLKRVALVPHLLSGYIRMAVWMEQP
jgi:hypothetical protein